MGRGSSGKGRPQKRHYWGKGGHGRKGSGANRRSHGDFDLEEVCNSLGDLPNLEEVSEAAKDLCSQLCSQAFDAFIRELPDEAEERERLQSALEGSLFCFNKPQRLKIMEKLGPHGFELVDCDSGKRSANRRRRSDGGGASERRGGRGSDRRGGERRGGGGGGDRELRGRRGEGGFKAGRRLSRRAADLKKEMRPWNQVGKDGWTGANSIEVNWKPPESATATAENKEKDKDQDKEEERPPPPPPPPQPDQQSQQKGDNDSVEGVTAKSTPAKPPSPIRGPVGRGRENTKPAWMTKDDKLPPPSLTGPADASSSTGAEGDGGGSPARGPAGRGRGSVKPAWIKPGDSEPASPSIPRGEGSAADEDPFRDLYKDPDRDTPWKDGDGWDSHRQGKGSRRGRSRSRRRGKEEWYASRDNGHEQRSSSDWKDFKGDSSWKHGDDAWGSSGKWTNSAWGGRWQSSSQGSHAWQGWDQETLVCVEHNAKRSWDKLIGDIRGWVCRPGCECVVYVGGSKATKGLVAILQDRAAAAPRPQGHGEKRSDTSVAEAGAGFDTHRSSGPSYREARRYVPSVERYSSQHGGHRSDKGRSVATSLGPGSRKREPSSGRGCSSKTARQALPPPPPPPPPGRPGLPPQRTPPAVPTLQPHLQAMLPPMMPLGYGYGGYASSMMTQAVGYPAANPAPVTIDQEDL